jgi:hypothetical protein
VQHGYDVSLLDPSRAVMQPSPFAFSDDATTVVKAEAASPAPPPIPKRTPFFKTIPGIILIVICAVIVTGAVVGGAVGATLNKKGTGTRGT